MRGAPNHPQTQGKIERWHQTLKNRILLENHFQQESLEAAIDEFVGHYNHRRYLRKQQQASVWPHLEFQRSFRGVSGSERLDINLRNSGIGPAKIELIEFFLDGAALRNWDEARGPFTGADANIYSHIGVSGRVMRPDDEFAILSLMASEIDPQSIIAIRDAVDQGRLAGRICYCSVFEECWLLVSETREPEPVRRCPEPALENTF